MQKTFRLLTSVTAVCAAFSTLPAMAEEEVYQTEELTVTAARVEQELMDVNMSVSVVTPEQIRHSSARTVGELLEDVPGVRINSDGSQGMKRVSIRGEDTFRTLVLIDGQRVSEHKSMSGTPILVDPSQIERIEVLKGPTSVLYGSDAIGGAINIITKKGGEKPLEGEVSAGISTAASGKTASASLFGANEGWKYRFTAAIEDDDELNTPKGDMKNTYFSSKSASGFLSYDITPNATVGATISYYDLEFGSSSVTYYNTSTDFAVDVPEWKQTKFGLFGEFTNVNDYLVRLRADAYWQRNDKDMVNTIDTAATPVVNISVKPYAENTLDTYGFSVQSDWQLGDNNYLIAGYEFTYDDLDADSLTTVTMSYMGNVMGSSAYTDANYSGYQMKNALYATMETKLPADFTLNYGVRYTWVKTDMDTTDHLSGDAKTSRNETDGKAVFNAGLVWRGVEDLALRALYSQGYRFPILQELYIDTNMGQSGSTTYANPNLKPETSDNFEVGMRWTPGPLSVDLAVFYSKADDYISTTYKSALGAYQYDNISEATTYGAELASSFAVPGTGFTPYATVTFMKRKFEEEGFSTYKSATPKFFARYGVRWAGEYDGSKIRLDAYAKSMTATEYEESTHSDDYRLGGATTLNFTGGISCGPEHQYSLDMGLYNITNRAYREQQSIYEPGRYFAVKLNAKF